MCGFFLTTQCLLTHTQWSFFYYFKNTKDNTNFDTTTTVLYVKLLLEDGGLCTEKQTWHHIFVG